MSKDLLNTYDSHTGDAYRTKAAEPAPPARRKPSVVEDVCIGDAFFTCYHEYFVLEIFDDRSILLRDEADFMHTFVPAQMDQLLMETVKFIPAGSPLPESVGTMCEPVEPEPVLAAAREYVEQHIDVPCGYQKCGSTKATHIWTPTHRLEELSSTERVEVRNDMIGFYGNTPGIRHATIHEDSLADFGCVLLRRNTADPSWEGEYSYNTRIEREFEKAGFVNGDQIKVTLVPKKAGGSK